MKYDRLYDLRKPITLRPLPNQEHQALVAGLRSTSSFTLRRCQLLWASPRGQHARQIADSLCGGDQTVRHVIHEFNTRGLAALQPRSTAPHHLPHAVFDRARREQLRGLLHQSPRTFG